MCQFKLWAICNSLCYSTGFRNTTQRIKSTRNEKTSLLIFWKTKCFHLLKKDQRNQEWSLFIKSKCFAIVGCQRCMGECMIDCTNCKQWYYVSCVNACSTALNSGFVKVFFLYFVCLFFILLLYVWMMKYSGVSSMLPMRSLGNSHFCLSVLTSSWNADTLFSKSPGIDLLDWKTRLWWWMNFLA